MTRDENGRFIKGVSGNPKGRALRVAEEDFKRLIDRAMTNDDWIVIVDKAVDQAKRGDNRAREWLTDRRYGKAPLPIQHSGEDGGPIIFEVVRGDKVQNLPADTARETSGDQGK